MRSTRLADFQLDQWLPAGVRVDDLIALLAALTVFAVFFAMWQALREHTPFERRLAQIVQRRQVLREGAYPGGG